MGKSLNDVAYRRIELLTPLVNDMGFEINRDSNGVIAQVKIPKGNSVFLDATDYENGLLEVLNLISGCVYSEIERKNR